MNRRITALLVLVFGGLLAFSVLINTARQSQRGLATLATLSEGPLFPAVQPGAISRITISGAQGKITLVKVPGDWQISSANGTPFPADNAQIAKVIQILATMRYNRILQGQDGSAYGLAGDGKVRIDFAAEAVHTLRIGNPAQIGDSSYVQRDDDPAIYMVPSAALDLLSGLLARPSPTP